MIEEIIERNGERVTHVRSDAGKLLYIKTRAGYELKCSRSKQICLIRYEDMLSDCISCLKESLINAKECDFIKDKKVQRLLSFNDK